MKREKKLDIPAWLAFLAIVLICFGYRVYSDMNMLREGNRATHDVFAPVDIVDTRATELARENAASRTKDIYRILPGVQIDIWESISKFISSARELKADSSLSETGKVKALSDLVMLNLDKSVYEKAIALDFDRLNDLSYYLDRVLNQILSRGISEDDLKYEKQALTHNLKSVFKNEDEYQVALALLNELLIPNKFLDSQATEEERKKARDAVADIMIPKGQKIISEGKIIDSYSYQLMKNAGVSGDIKNVDIDKQIPVVGLLAVSIAAMAYYFETFYTKNSARKIRMILFIDALLLLISVVAQSESKLFMPIGLASVLVCLLSDRKTSLINIIFYSVISMQLVNVGTTLSCAYTAGAILLIFMVSKNTGRAYVLMSSVLYGAFVMMITALRDYRQILDGNYSFLVGLLPLIANGFAVGVISIGTLPLWEKLFGVLTDAKLMELSDTNNELLHRLLIEAPGTYHHSMMVGTLGEACAEAISANQLLCRVGGYYHDIGKLKNPMYFKENQLDLANPHDLLSPMESAEIIIEHVSYGLELGKSHKLPVEILDIINEHHGTSLVGYFYALAKKTDENVNVDDFMYKGKKPQTKESAIIRFSDACEAAVRSIKIPTAQAVDDMIDKIFSSNISSDQLYECPIRMDEIMTIKEIMKSQIKSIYHSRIEYPKVAEEASGGLK